ncbi:MAG TPA: acetate--CoA ligase family protein [Streptosporangiaceae bacterium]|nr:acetate--CoA ligase family protein [Streptosporangiaceae bacterium]
MTREDGASRRPEASDAKNCSLVSPERLREFFAPRSIAVVGASDASGWARFVLASNQVAGFGGPLIPVHPRHETVFGRAAVRSLRDLDAPADCAFIMVPSEAVEEVLADAGAAGVRGAVVLAAGYRELGEDGRELERRMIGVARAHGITLLGPNCLGFLNAHARAAPFALTVPSPLLPGPVGIALQSGALASVVLAFARAHAIGVSTLATMGNEAMIAATDVLDYLIEDDATRVICLFLEEISDPVRFARAAERADRAGKPIVAVKVGASPAGREVALAHTGAVAGDDAVVDAALRQLNVIRVRSIEEMLCTAALLGYDRWPRGRRMGVISTSGGACDLIADRAAADGIELPEFAAQTADAITPLLPSFAAVRNPLDVTGYFLANRRTSALTAVDHALDAAVDDPGFDFIVYTGLTLPDTRPPDETAATMLGERAAWLGDRIASAPIPVIAVAHTCVNVSDYGRGLLRDGGVQMLGGIDLGMTALGHALRWLENRGRPELGVLAAFGGGGGTRPSGGGRPWPEAAARDLLAGAGIPIVPGELVTSADAAVAAARRFGPAVVLKICSAQIGHKSDVGGVALGVRGDDEVRAAYARVLAAGQAAAGAGIDGVLVSPMRTGGVELIAGVSVDPTFGPVLAVGLGGVWVEVLADTSLRVLPAGRAEVRRMLGELRGGPLLRGARGTRPADLDALASVIVKLGEVAVGLNGSLRALEVNPLWVDGDRIEALDVLVVTADPRSADRSEP